MNRASAIYTGHVRHRRFVPVRHEFRYRLYMLYLDLEELPSLFSGTPFWSSRRPALAWFRRADYLGDASVDLAEAVRARVGRATGARPVGPIRMLTQLRTWGYCFNPVTFYYCFDPTGARVDAVAAEITNTPWQERHTYTLARDRSTDGGATLRFALRKEFHVSPFFDMDLDYEWRVSEPGASLTVQMVNLDAGREVFDATLTLRRSEIAPGRLNALLLRYPFMTAKVIAAIHWQALRLWAKRCPFHPHPKKRAAHASEDHA